MWASCVTLPAMRRPSLAAATAVAALCLASVALAQSAQATPGNGRAVGHHDARVCDTAPAGQASCDAIRHDAVDSSGTVVPNATTVPAGAYGPGDIQSAYALPTTATVNASGAPNGPLVAIVDAYDDPYAEKDLGVYRSHYGLPACTTANGCFKKVNQSGGSKMPRANGGWAQEISLDLDMVSAACPGCRILLVEASSASFSNLAAAVNTAANKGAVAISNSYGGSDSTAMPAFDHPGIAITASTGDSGYGVQSPASFPTVVAVGGTSLTRASNARGWSETAWSGAGSGCSTINANPGWQVTPCNGQKANADVSAVADPNTGVAVYDSYAYQGASGWLQFGGTSASSPIVASVYALGGNHGFNYPAQWTWANAGNAAVLNDVVGGSNGTCSPSTLCTAVAGWDGPTGLGTPKGIGAF